MTFGEVVRLYMEERGMSQSDLRTDYRHYLSPEGAAVDGAAVKLSAYLSAKTADVAQTCEWRIVS